MRKAEEFKEAQQKNNISHWPVHDCSICGYECSYIFNYITNELTYEVVYDSGCYCTNRYVKDLCDWGHVARHYNMQTNPEVIKDYDKFWGFDNE